jgi:hypothetical protein
VSSAAAVLNFLASAAWLQLQFAGAWLQQVLIVLQGCCCWLSGVLMQTCATAQLFLPLQDLLYNPVQLLQQRLLP